MSDVKGNNPAGRLYLILEEARSKANGLATKQVWSEVLKHDKNTDNVFAYLSSLQVLVAEVKHKVCLHIPDLKSQYLTLYDNIERVTGATNLDAQWSSYRPLLTDAVMVELRFCWIGLRDSCLEKEIDQDKLMSLLSEIRKLIQDALDSDFDITLKQIIVDLLMGVEQSIIEFQLRGPESLQKNLERILGSLRFNYDLFKDKEGSPIINGLWSVMVSINEITTFALNVPPLFAGTSFALKALTA